MVFGLQHVHAIQTSLVLVPSVRCLIFMSPLY